MFVKVQSSKCKRDGMLPQNINQELFTLFQFKVKNNWKNKSRRHEKIVKYALFKNKITM